MAARPAPADPPPVDEDENGTSDLPSPKARPASHEAPTPPLPRRKRPRTSIFYQPEKGADL
jgi:hypothetical protein